MATSEATDEIEEMILKLLNARFKDEFEFGPVVVMPRIDDDGEVYLHSYIVFHGDQSRLDPAWTLRLSDSLWSRALELGYPGMPTQLFVDKSEWPELEEMLS